MRIKHVVTTLIATSLAALSAQADWPQFRGPKQDGHAIGPGGGQSVGLPLKWSETENVKWKTALDQQGWSSPVVMQGRIWLTHATPDGKDFFVSCVDDATGKILLDEKLFHSDSPEPLGNNVNCYASPSPAVEQGRVYVHFGSYGTACLDSQTFKTIWKRDDLPCRHFRGPASSVVLHENLLILTMDGVDQQYLTALNKADGKTAWRTDRTTEWGDIGANGKPAGDGDSRKGFTTPLIVELAGKTQMISAGSKAAYSYDPRSGMELWKIRYPGHTPAMTAVAGQGLVFIATGNGPSELLAVRLDGSGDVTDSHVVWKASRGVPRMPSPILTNNRLYLPGDNGVVTCLQASTGRELWQERIGGSLYASPVLADGRIFCFSSTGETTVLKEGDTFELLTRNQLDGGFMASPAISGRAFILRTKTHLYRIEAIFAK